MEIMGIKFNNVSLPDNLKVDNHVPVGMFDLQLVAIQIFWKELQA